MTGRVLELLGRQEMTTAQIHQALGLCGEMRQTVRLLNTMRAAGTLRRRVVGDPPGPARWSVNTLPVEVAYAA